MVTTNDKIIIWWLTNRKHKKHVWLDTITLMKKSHVPPPKKKKKKNDVHTSEDILTKTIRNFPLTLNFFWVEYLFCSITWDVKLNNISAYNNKVLVLIFTTFQYTNNKCPLTVQW